MELSYFPATVAAVIDRTPAAFGCSLRQPCCPIECDSIVHMTADEIKALLRLEPHPVEGGFYRRTYTSMGHVPLTRGTRALGFGDLLPAGAGNLLRDAHAGLRRDVSFLPGRSGGDAATGRRWELRRLYSWTGFGGGSARRNSWSRPACGRVRGWWRVGRWRCWAAPLRRGSILPITTAPAMRSWRRNGRSRMNAFGR